MKTATQNNSQVINENIWALVFSRTQGDAIASALLKVGINVLAEVDDADNVFNKPEINKTLLNCLFLKQYDEFARLTKLNIGV